MQSVSELGNITDAPLTRKQVEIKAQQIAAGQLGPIGVLAPYIAWRPEGSLIACAQQRKYVSNLSSISCVS